MSSYPSLSPADAVAHCPPPAVSPTVFHPVEFADGRTQLFDRRGHGCGLFVNKQLAEQTARKVGALAR